MREATPLSRPREPGAIPGTDVNRRPIRSRNALWAQAAASYLARLGVSPNQISLASVLAAGVGAVGLGFFPQPWNAISCVCGVQLRLLCNLLDGMVAVEHGKRSQLGVLYNEFPDRVSDSVLFVALGYASGLAWLGWLGALLAALTAYIGIQWYGLFAIMIPVYTFLILPSFPVIRQETTHFLERTARLQWGLMLT